MAIAALLARVAKTPSTSASTVAASDGEATASAPTSSPRFDIGSTSNDPRPGSTRLRRFPAITSGAVSHPSNTSGIARCGSITLTPRRSPSRSAIAAAAPSPAIDAAVQTTSRCSSGTPPVVLVSARATALTRSTALSTGTCGFAAPFMLPIIRTTRPASADESVTTAKQTGRQLRLLATSDPPDVRGVADHHEGRHQSGEDERHRVVASGALEAGPERGGQRSNRHGPAEGESADATGRRPGRRLGRHHQQAPERCGDCLPAPEASKDGP